MSTMLVNRSPDNPATMVTEENEHEYRKPRPLNRLCADVLQAILQTSPALKRRRLYLDQSMTIEQENKQRDVGVFTGRFGGWAATVNWTTQERDGIPPHHIAVRFKDVPIALIPPYTDMRTDWRGRIVQPADLHRDAVEAVARATDRDRLFGAMGGAKLDYELKQQKGDIASY